MRKDKKPLWRWIGEATLIFLTILAAFYVDNYRDHKAQESLYLKHLQDFGNDLASGIQSMSFELNSDGDKLNQSGYLVSGLASYDSLVNMISTGNKSSVNSTMSLLAVYANQRFSK